MTDPELIAKQLAFVETMVADLRRLARPDAIKTDLREERFVAHTLQMAAQATLDVASHIVSDERLGEPQTNQELFVLGLAVGRPGCPNAGVGRIPQSPRSRLRESRSADTEGHCLEPPR